MAARIAAILLSAFLVSGCASLLTSKEPVAGTSESFELQARVFVRFATGAFSGSIRWRHAQASDEVWLGGPLGQTAAHIERGAEGATLTTADQQSYRSSSIEDLTRRGLGWALPLAELSYYVLGQIPQGLTEDRVERDAQRRISRLVHDGWDIDLTHAELPSATPHPIRLRMRKDDVEIRLVIDQLEQAQG